RHGARGEGGRGERPVRAAARARADGARAGHHAPVAARHAPVHLTLSHVGVVLLLVLALAVPAASPVAGASVGERTLLDNDRLMMIEFVFPPGFRGDEHAAVADALADDVVFDLAALAADRASEQGAVRRGRGGFPKTMLALIQGATDAWNEARQALDHGLALLGREGLDRLAERRLASPLARVRLE